MKKVYNQIIFYRPTRSNFRFEEATWKCTKMNTNDNVKALEGENKVDDFIFSHCGNDMYNCMDHSVESTDTEIPNSKNCRQFVINCLQSKSFYSK